VSIILSKFIEIGGFKMSIYEKYEKYGLTDYKLKTASDVLALHGTDVTKMKGLNKLSGEDRELVIRLFIGYLNGCGCGNRNDVPVAVTKINGDKFKVSFENGMFSYFYRNGTIG